MAKISPSILAADLSNLSREVRKVIGADLLHVDVMDGVFVPNITFGTPIMEALGRIDHPPLDVHLMIEDPGKFIAEYVQLGARNLHVHVEGNPHLHRLITSIKDLGASPFVVINPATPVQALEEILPFVDGVLVMTVNPRFTGQKFIAGASLKIDRLHRLRDELGYSYEIAVDGGVSLSNAGEPVERGADILIMGAAVFRAASPSKVVEKIRELKR